MTTVRDLPTVIKDATASRHASVQKVMKIVCGCIDFVFADCVMCGCLEGFLLLLGLYSVFKCNVRVCVFSLIRPLLLMSLMVMPRGSTIRSTESQPPSERPCTSPSCRRVARRAM